MSLAWHASRQQQEALVATLCALTSALDARDPYTRGHSDRVAAYSVAIADMLGWSRRRRRALEIPAHLHDVGKIGISDEILRKPGRFTPDERAVMEGHPVGSWAIVRNVPDLARIATMIRQHHERLDGSGYPDGLAGEAISPEAQIMAVADVYDALTSDRPYRSGVALAGAISEIERGSGVLFSPEVVRALGWLVLHDRIDATLQYAYCLSH